MRVFRQLDSICLFRTQAIALNKLQGYNKRCAFLAAVNGDVQVDVGFKMTQVDKALVFAFSKLGVWIPVPTLCPRMESSELTQGEPECSPTEP